jgi:flagellar basal body-associated protein FliL
MPRSRDDYDRTPRRSKSNRAQKSAPWLIIGIVAGVLVLGGSVGLYFALKSKKSAGATDSANANPPTTEELE